MVGAFMEKVGGNSERVFNGKPEKQNVGRWSAVVAMAIMIIFSGTQVVAATDDDATLTLIPDIEIDGTLTLRENVEYVLSGIVVADVIQIPSGQRVVAEGPLTLFAHDAFHIDGEIVGAPGAPLSIVSGEIRVAGTVVGGHGRDAMLVEAPDDRTVQGGHGEDGGDVVIAGGSVVVEETGNILISSGGNGASVTLETIPPGDGDIEVKAGDGGNGGNLALIARDFIPDGDIAVGQGGDGGRVLADLSGFLVSDTLTAVGGQGGTGGTIILQVPFVYEDPQDLMDEFAVPMSHSSACGQPGVNSGTSEQDNSDLEAGDGNDGFNANAEGNHGGKGGDGCGRGQDGGSGGNGGDAIAKAGDGADATCFLGAGDGGNAVAKGGLGGRGGNGAKGQDGQSGTSSSDGMKGQTGAWGGKGGSGGGAIAHGGNGGEGRPHGHACGPEPHGRGGDATATAGDGGNGGSGGPGGDGGAGCDPGDGGEGGQGGAPGSPGLQWEARPGGGDTIGKRTEQQGSQGNSGASGGSGSGGVNICSGPVPDPCELPGDLCQDPPVPQPCDLPGQPCEDPEVPQPCDRPGDPCEVPEIPNFRNLISGACNKLGENMDAGEGGSGGCISLPVISRPDLSIGDNFVLAPADPAFM